MRRWADDLAAPLINDGPDAIAAMGGDLPAPNHLTTSLGGPATMTPIY